MEKYLVFSLECFDDVPCFKLVKEFYVVGGGDYQKVKVDEWAEQYSLENKVRTVVIKGTVFGD